MNGYTLKELRAILNDVLKPTEIKLLETLGESSNWRTCIDKSTDKRYHCWRGPSSPHELVKRLTNLKR